MKKRLISLFLGAMVIGMVAGCKADNVKEVERIVVAESIDTTVVHLEDDNKEEMNFEVDFVNSDPIKVFVDNVRVDGKPVEVESVDIIKDGKVEVQVSPIKGEVVEGEVVILKTTDGTVVKETLPFYIIEEW